MSIYRENLVPRQFWLAKPFRTILARDHYRSRHGITQPTRIYKHSAAGTDWAALMLGAG
jgi:hypothetical protein